MDKELKSYEHAMVKQLVEVSDIMATSNCSVLGIFLCIILAIYNDSLSC